MGYTSVDISGAHSARDITPHDSTNLPAGCRSIYVGVGGTVVVVFPDDTVTTFLNVASGQVLPVQAKRINSTSTTATNMLALY